MVMKSVEARGGFAHFRRRAPSPGKGGANPPPSGGVGFNFVTRAFVPLAPFAAGRFHLLRPPRPAEIPVALPVPPARSEARLALNTG